MNKVLTQVLSHTSSNPKLKPNATPSTTQPQNRQVLVLLLPLVTLIALPISKEYDQIFIILVLIQAFLQ